jgi:putative spermidine/putrescine transport system permease protein
MKQRLIIVLGSIFALPFAYMVLLSVAKEWFFPALWPGAITDFHWKQLDSTMFWAIGLSVGIAFFIGVISTLAGFLSAYYLARHPWRRWCLVLAYLPYAFSPVIYAHCIKYFFLVSDLAGRVTGVVLAQFILCYPFAFLLFYRHFDDDLNAMEDLSATLGAGQRAAFLRVILPISKEALLLCFAQTFLISWFEYGLSSVIGLGQVRTLTVMAYQYIGASNQYLAAVTACLICFPPLLLLWINQRFVFRSDSLQRESI